MSLNQKLEAMVREFAGRVMHEVLRSTLEDIGTEETHLCNDSVDGSPLEVSGPAPRKARRSAAMTPKRRAALKVQGRYLGLLRHFNKDGQDEIKKVGREKGNVAAIKVMEQSLRTRAVRGRKIVALQKSGKLTSSKTDRILGISTDLLPTNQAAAYLGISRSTFRERIEKGLIKPTEIRKVQGEQARYFSKRDLDRHLAKHPVRQEHRHGNRKAANR
jgi:excisionase family DNA binding protein